MDYLTCPQCQDATLTGINAAEAYDSLPATTENISHNSATSEPATATTTEIAIARKTTPAVINSKRGHTCCLRFDLAPARVGI